MSDQGASSSEEASDREAPSEGRGTVVLDNVLKVYPGTDVPAVSEVSLSIRSGEFFSLLGPSGSGKTTTLRLIAGFEQPTEGTIQIAGKEVSGLPPFKRPVHTVFQNYALFPHMNVERNVAYPLRMRRLDKKVITEQVGAVLERVSMSEYTKRLPHQLSGGQRQRVALARALVGQPEVVLLDEPLGALDLKLRQEMQLVLKHLQREVGITFVLRHPRPGRGACHVRQDRDPVQRSHQSGSHTIRRLLQAGYGVRCDVRRQDQSPSLSLGRGREGHAQGSDLEGRPHTGASRLRPVDSSRVDEARHGSGRCENTVRGMVEEGIFQGTDVELRVRA